MQGMTAPVVFGKPARERAQGNGCVTRRHGVMVAVDTSKWPGQFDPWNNVLGMLGLFGRGDLGEGGCLAYVNGVTGNLALQFRDAQVSDLAADLMPVRIYNSQGSGWQWDSGAPSDSAVTSNELVIGYATVGGKTRVEHLHTFERSNTPRCQVLYLYDLSGRLSAVKTMLNQGDATPECSIDTYTYDNDSDRIVSISRSDDSGDAVTVMRFTYEQVGTSSTFRIRTVTDASGTQTFIYHGAVAGRGRTDLVDAEGQTWTYVYDAGTSQLLEVHSPSANGERPVATFHYDGQAMSLG
jgi:YD repeat-containing protein